MQPGSTLTAAFRFQNASVPFVINLLLTHLRMAEVSLEERLYHCCRDGLLSDALLLIAKGANVNWTNALENDATPIYVACYNGHDQVALALARAGADVDACNRAGMFSLFIAAQCVGQ